MGATLAAATLVACQFRPPPSEPSEPLARPGLRVATSGGHRGDVPPEADAGGKYARLLEVVHAPEDESTYGRVHEYGLWGPGEWAGAMRPRGYWVYVAPRWYVWEGEASAAGVAPVATDATSANGRYGDLIKTVHAPEDRETYGDFKDFGAWGPGEWAGEMQPAGYWVYVAPKWYIWKTQRR